MTPKEIALKCAEICEECRVLLVTADDAVSGAQEAGNDLARQIRAYAETLSDNGVWVPNNPTEQMLTAGGYWWYATLHNAHSREHNAAIIYSAMLAAAPKGDSNG